MKTNFKRLSLLLVLMFTLILGACTPKTTTTANTKAGETKATETKVDKKASETVYPYEYKSKDGKTVKLEKEPQKVLSLSPTMTETIFAIGKGNALVGRTDFCNYPEEAKKVESIGSITNPSIEKIVAAKPDLVIASMLKPEIVTKIEQAGIKVIFMKNGDSINGSFENMKEVGKILNAQEKTEEMIQNITKKIDSVKEKVKDVKTKKNIYYALGYGKSGDFTSGDKTFINDLIETAGAVNVAKDAEGWKYTSEKLMSKNPDLIFMGSMSKAKDGFMTTDPYKNLNAVKNNQVFEVNDDLINREGPRMGDGLESLAKLFYPELFK